MNIPNILTTIRLILVPFIGYFFYQGYPDDKKSLIIAVILFLIAGLTDVLDGRIARKYNQVTNLGKILDPIADKFFQFTVALVFVLKSLIPLWVVIIIVIKELFMGLGVLLLYKKQDIVTGSFWYGKFATVVFYCAILIIVLFRLTKPASTVVISIGVIPLIYAFYRYVRLFFELSNEKNTVEQIKE